ncbi:MAG: hypothetical protein DSY85_06445 [Marinomonas sp.]|nr:MAG: hypothetical protein DSY85_06445 [Marinomonas sp.]
MAFTEELYRQFGNRASQTLRTDLGYNRQESTELAELVVGLLVQKGPEAYSEIHDFLVNRGVQHRWNGIFHHCRSAAVAQWLLPHVRGNLIDLLCGSGRIGGILSDLGVPTSLSERYQVRDSYPVVETARPWLDHDSLEDEAKCRSYDTVLLSTALHHEPDPERLLELALRLASRRVLIVENCVEDDLSPEMHILVDDFFNYCLNNTPLPCPAQHRTVDDWSEMLKGRARIVFSDRRDSLPGIPLSHHLIVAEVIH